MQTWIRCFGRCKRPLFLLYSLRQSPFPPYLFLYPFPPELFFFALFLISIPSLGTSGTRVWRLPKQGRPSGFPGATILWTAPWTGSCVLVHENDCKRKKESRGELKPRVQQQERSQGWVLFASCWGRDQRSGLNLTLYPPPTQLDTPPEAAHSFDTHINILTCKHCKITADKLPLIIPLASFRTQHFPSVE